MDPYQPESDDPAQRHTSHEVDVRSANQDNLLFNQWIPDLPPDINFDLDLLGEDLAYPPRLDSTNDTPPLLDSTFLGRPEPVLTPARESNIALEGTAVFGTSGQNNAYAGDEDILRSITAQPRKPGTLNRPRKETPNGKETTLIKYRRTGPRARKSGTTGPARHRNVLAQDKAPKFDVRCDENGSIQGSFQVFGAKERIRSRLTPAARSASLQTRRVGACERCRRQKLRCNIPEDPLLPCHRCLAVSTDVLKQPCIRVSILDLKLHRMGSTRNNDLETWTHNQRLRYELGAFLDGKCEADERYVCVTQDQGVAFRVRIARFSPEMGDTTAWKWRDSASNERNMEMPPYYISDTAEAASNMRQAALAGRSEYVDCLLAGANSILRKTFEAAYRYLETTESTLVSNALTFWVATRFIERPWRICEGTIPCFDSPNENDCPYNGIIPVTPVMDTQIDHLALQTLLLPLGLNILKELDSNIRNNRRENWFEIFLTTFILMNNFEFVFADVIDYTTRHGLKASSTGAPSLSKGYFHACKTLLSYFHFACHGADPLSLCWTGRAPRADILPFDQQGYLADIKQDVDRQAESYKAWRHGSMYETPLYWCYQVISTDWKPDVPHATPIDDFTEEDFLTS